MTSPSIPVISEMLVTFRVPSLIRDCCMTTWMADAICWRIAFSGRFVAPIEIIVSIRVSASRGRVRVNGRQRSVVTGVHGLEHVQRFFTADLADDDAVGTHTQGVDDQLPLADGALAFDVGRPGFEPRHVFLVQLQLRGVLDRDDALALGDEAR